MSKKIFISYNHKDGAYALKIRDVLLANGASVLIDVERMRSGENIEQFIMNCIRDSDTTLSLISANSLMSAWVAMETVNSGVDEKIRSRQFIPCYIDPAFFDRNFTSKALDVIDGHLKEIDSLISSAIEKNRGFEDLQGERTRYRRLKDNLPEIVGKLRNSLCIDLTEAQFETGMQKVVKDLQLPGSTEAIAANDPAKEALQALTEQINNIIDESEKQRLASLKDRLLQLQQLKSKYEEEFDLEDDPKRKMRYEKEIANTSKMIEKVESEIQTPIQP